MGRIIVFYGKVSDATINLTKKFSIKNLTTEINHDEEVTNNEFVIIIKEGSLFNIELADTTINLKRENNETKIRSLLRTNGKLNFSQIKKVAFLFGLNADTFKDINGTLQT